MGDVAYVRLGVNIASANRLLKIREARLEIKIKIVKAKNVLALNTAVL